MSVGALSVNTWGDWLAVILEAVELACPGANELDVMPQVCSGVW